MERRKMLFDRPFKSVVIHGPGRASLEDIVLPQLKPGEVLIRVAYAGVSATDLEIYEGRLASSRREIASYPIVPGHEVSGIVVASGSRVEDIREGDRVVVERIRVMASAPLVEAGIRSAAQVVRRSA